MNTAASMSTSKSLRANKPSDLTRAEQDDWKLLFICEKAQLQYRQWVAALSHSLEACQQSVGSDERLQLLRQASNLLRSIRDKLIGNSCCKFFFIRLNLLQVLVPLLWMKDESSAEFTRLLLECQKDALTLIAAMINCGLNGASEPNMEAHALPESLANELFINLLRLLQQNSASPASEKTSKYLEVLTKCLLWFTRRIDTVRHLVFEPENLDILTQLLDPRRSSPATLQHLACILAQGCDSPARQSILVGQKVLSILLGLIQTNVSLDPMGRPVVVDGKILDGSIELAGALSRENGDVSQALASFSIPSQPPKRLPTLLFQLLNFSSLSIELKMKAALMLANMYRAGALQSFALETQTTLLSFLIGLIDGPEALSVRAMFLISLVITEEETLQSICIQMNVVPLLLKTLSKAKNQDAPIYAQVLESSLILTAALSSVSEDCRKVIVDSKLLPNIVEALDHPSADVRIAACQCARNLSRSVKNLRTSLFDSGIVKPLLKLLKDSGVVVQTTACATLCNMVLEFTPLKKVIVNEGGISDLIQLVGHVDTGLRVNAIWALKNLLYHSDAETRSKVLGVLSFDQLYQLLEEGNELVQEQTLNLIRNIGCGRQEHIDEVFKGFGTARFTSIIESKLQMSSPAIVMQTLYIIVNVATGSELHKSRIMESSLMVQGIMNNLSHDNPKIRLAAVWCLINLTWPNEPGFTERASFLLQMGSMKLLKAMQNDPDYEVRQKVTCAVANFTAAQ